MCVCQRERVFLPTPHLHKYLHMSKCICGTYTHANTHSHTEIRKCQDIILGFLEDNLRLVSPFLTYTRALTSGYLLHTQTHAHRQRMRYVPVLVLTVILQEV